MSLTNLQVTEIMNSALVAFRIGLLPIRVFSTAVRKSSNEFTKGDTVKVPWYPLDGDAAKDFAGTYDFSAGGDKPNASGIDVAINKRKYKPLITTSAERERYHFDPAKLGQQKGRKLAHDVVVDVLSIVTAANYGTAGLDLPPASFDSDEVANLRGVCKVANWGDEDNALVLGSTYETPLLQDGSIKSQDQFGDRDPILNGMLRRLLGFDLVTTEVIPDNSETLQGFASHPSAVLVGFSPIQPDPAVRERLTAYEVATDPETGLTIEYRLWGDPDSDSRKEVFECNYGYVKGDGAALKRIIDTP